MILKRSFKCVTEVRAFVWREKSDCEICMVFVLPANIQ